MQHVRSFRVQLNQLYLALPTLCRRSKPQDLAKHGQICHDAKSGRIWSGDKVELLAYGCRVVSQDHFAVLDLWNGMGKCSVCRRRLPI